MEKEAKDFLRRNPEIRREVCEMAGRGQSGGGGGQLCEERRQEGGDQERPATGQQAQWWRW